MRFLLKMEQVHVLTDAPVIALGGFLEPDKVRVELLLVQPAGAVDAAQHRVILIAAPISARHARELERLRVELAGRGKMRAAAHVEPGARPVDRQLFAFGKFGGPLGFERLAIRLPFRDQVGSRPDFAHKLFIATDDCAHFCFDRRQVFFGKRAIFGGKIIIKAIVGRRAERDLRRRKQILDGFGKDMGKVVSRQFERIGFVAGSNQRQAGVAIQRPHDVAQLTVYPRGNGGFGEAGPNARRNIGRRRASRDFAHRTIG